MAQPSKTKKTIVKPLENRVVAERLKEETLKGGLIIPDSAQKKQEMAKVVAVGPGKKTDSDKSIPVPVKVGDVILVDKYAGQEITIDDQEYVIVRSDDIIAIVE